MLLKKLQQFFHALDKYGYALNLNIFPFDILIEQNNIEYSPVVQALGR